MRCPCTNCRRSSDSHSHRTLLQSLPSSTYTFPYCKCLDYRPISSPCQFYGPEVQQIDPFISEFCFDIVCSGCGANPTWCCQRLEYNIHKFMFGVRECLPGILQQQRGEAEVGRGGGTGVATVCDCALWRAWGMQEAGVVGVVVAVVVGVGLCSWPWAANTQPANVIEGWRNGGVR